MARFYGDVGYGTPVETVPGVWNNVMTESPYFGDILRNTSQNQPDPTKLNDDIVIQNRISIVADQYAIDNAHLIKYVRWNGELWTVSSVEIQSPRLILSIGKVYNGPTP